MHRKGIILAGGHGTRLHPVTQVVSKQLLPVYDKPMIYYPLSTLMQAGIRDILIITTNSDQRLFKNLLGDGTDLGIQLSYAVQPVPRGLPDAVLIAETFLGSDPFALILGDNLFYGQDLNPVVSRDDVCPDGATIFAYPVSDPCRYGVVSFDEYGSVQSLEEKPKKPKSRYAVTGLYFYDQSAIDRSKLLKPSSRGEIEITDLNRSYLRDGQLHVKRLGRGMAWLDTGTVDSLHEASSYIQTLEHRQGLKIGCPEEIAWRNGWITDEQLLKHSAALKRSGYGSYLESLLNAESW